MAVFCAVGGVEPQSETVWRQAERYKVPRMAFVNKMDRQGANFDNVLQMMRDRLKANAVAIQYPWGSEDKMKGIFDLVKMKAIVFDGEKGENIIEQEIPEEYLEKCNEMREHLVEAIAEIDESVMEKYLEGEEVSLKEIQDGIRKGALELAFTPVVCGTAFKNKGVQTLLDAIVEYMPSPLDVPAITGELDDGSEGVREPDDDKTFCWFNFQNCHRSLCRYPIFRSCLFGCIAIWFNGV